MNRVRYVDQYSFPAGSSAATTPSSVAITTTSRATTTTSPSQPSLTIVSAGKLFSGYLTDSSGKPLANRKLSIYFSEQLPKLAILEEERDLVVVAGPGKTEEAGKTEEVTVTEEHEVKSTMITWRWYVVSVTYGSESTVATVVTVITCSSWHFDGWIMTTETATLIGVSQDISVSGTWIRYVSGWYGPPPSETGWVVSAPEGQGEADLRTLPNTRFTVVTTDENGHWAWASPSNAKSIQIMFDGDSQNLPCTAKLVAASTLKSLSTLPGLPISSTQKILVQDSWIYLLLFAVSLVLISRGLYAQTH